MEMAISVTAHEGMPASRSVAAARHAGDGRHRGVEREGSEWRVTATAEIGLELAAEVRLELAAEIDFELAAKIRLRARSRGCDVAGGACG